MQKTLDILPPKMPLTDLQVLFLESTLPQILYKVKPLVILYVSKGKGTVKAFVHFLPPATHTFKDQFFKKCSFFHAQKW